MQPEAADLGCELSSASVVQRSDRTAWQRFDREMVVLDVPTRTLLGLNHVGGMIWDRLDGLCTLEEIARQIAARYQQSVEHVRADVLAFTRTLLRRGYVELRQRA